MKSILFALFLYLVAGLILLTPAGAQDSGPVPDPASSAFTPYIFKGTFTLPSGTLLFDFLPDGRMVALADTEVMVEQTAGTRNFETIGTVPGLRVGPYGSNFLRVSPDGKHIAVGNTDPDSAQAYIGIFTLSALRGNWFLCNHFDAEWYNNKLLAITGGIFGKPSTVSVLDITSPPTSPQLTTVITNIGGASAGIAFDSEGNLFTGNGLTGSGPSTTGTIKRFAHAHWTAPLLCNNEHRENQTALDFEQQGTVIIDILSAGSLGFDLSGNLHIGGGDNLGDGMESNFAAMVNRAAIYDALKTGQPVNPEDELAVLRLDPDGDMNAASRYSVNSNPVSSALYLKGGPKVYVYASALALQDTPESATTLDKDNPNGLIIPTNTVGGDFISRSGTDEKDASESAPPLGKKNPNDLRILTYNVEGNFISHSGTDDALNRILSFLAPDILVLQEFQHNMVPNVAERLKNILGSDWHIFGGLHSGLYQNIIASRYPLAMTTQDTIPPSDTRGVTAALIDLPEPRFTKDIYVMGLHLQCCDSPVFQKQRQRSADAVISWLDDAKKDGGEITLVPGTPVVVLGDLNLVDDTQPGVTLQTGDIFDEMTFGPDRKPDWDGSYLTDVKPKDPFTGNSNTSHSKDEQPAIRYDRIFFTNSVATVARSFVLNTLNFDEDSLASAGLKKEDTATCSDHLPVVIDLRLL